MTTYAIADQVPEDCDYLTAGKEYEVIRDPVRDDLFVIQSDEGTPIICRWFGDCAHLNGGNWRRVER